MIIAEIGQAHDGSVGILHSYIDALAGTGIDAIKFQTHIAEAESSEYETFRIPFSYVDKTRFDYWKRMELSVEQWKEVKQHCDKVGLQFISSPFSCKAVDVLEEAGVSAYKIGSGEVTNGLLLQKIANTGKPVIISSGMSTMEELSAAIGVFEQKKTAVSLLQCTTAYPTQPEQWGLQIIKNLKSRFNIPVGYSDHSGEVVACMAATALGAEILEFHVVFDKRMFGPDAKASLTIDEVKMLTEGVRKIRLSMLEDFEKNAAAEKLVDLKRLFGKSLSVNAALPKGHVITFENLEAKKPAGYGIAPSEYEKVIGKRLSRSVQKWEFLNQEDIE
ncbi:MAG: N-acetylneuraminate synthase [Segetibacter sp.]|nr:N-acetylneuraminate synthase [Segetibacter sp.]